MNINPKLIKVRFQQNQCFLLKHILSFTPTKKRYLLKFSLIGSTRREKQWKQESRI